MTENINENKCKYFYKDVSNFDISNSTKLGIKNISNVQNWEILIKVCVYVCMCVCYI